VPDYNRIEDYGIIGDTLSTALISKGGSIDWLCWPRHDSGAVFLRLLDDEVGGFSDIVIEGGRATDRRYVDGTNILETTFATAVAEAVLTDFMPVRTSDPVPDEGPDLEARGALVRVLTCTKGSIRGRFRTKAVIRPAILALTQFWCIGDHVAPIKRASSRSSLARPYI
jgi:GH15 family glucan-1,4-alpha-glucosidase